MANELQHRHTATGSTIYGIVRDFFTGQVVVVSDGSLEDQVNANWDTYDIVLTESPASGYFYEGDMPAATAGLYVGTVYLRAGGSPALGDTIIGEWEPFHWNGTAVVSPLPYAAFDAAGGLPISDAGGLDLDNRIRGGYTGGAVFLDTNASNTNTVSFVDGVEHNPVSTLAAAITIAGNINSQKLVLVPGSSITLTQAHNNWIFDACHSTIALGGQSINNSVFIGAVITGNDDGSNANHTQYFDCVIGTNTLGQFVMTRCYFIATLTLAQAGSYFLHQCFSGIAGTSTPTLDFGSGLNASNVNIRDYSGGIEIQNMGAGTGSYNLSLEGNGQLIINANCSATSTVAIRGNFTVTDNAGGAVTLSDDARIDVAQINAECDTALSDWGKTGFSLTTGERNAVADALLVRDMDNVEATAPEHSLCTVVLASLESSLSGTTWTIKRTDGSTTHATKTVTTDGDADPVVSVN